MPVTRRTDKQTLLAENADLRARLEDAEELLRAIRGGEVDGLLVEGSVGPQVFTLQGVEADSNRFRGEILAQVSDAVIALDDEQRILYLNAAAERQYGVVAFEVLGRLVTEVYESRWQHPSDEVAALMSLRATGEWRGEKIHIKRSGESIPVESSVTRLLPGTGQPSCTLSVIRDISERKKVEEALRQVKEAAEAAANAKGAFLANMSHEIRTPLHVIIGQGHLLRRDVTHPAHRRKLDQLCASSDHLLAIINDILDLSKIDAAQLALDCSEFYLGELVEQAVRLVVGRAQEKGLNVMADLTPSLRDLRLQGDSLRLAQVLINLLGNAVKFTDQGSVSLEIVCLSEDAANVTLRFGVTDTGCGIAPADKAQLFQPFKQGDESTTREHGGTGLGLAISQRLVTLMGGKIEVASHVGAGSCFSFELILPHATSSLSPCADPVAPGAIDFHDKLVLLADDHPQSQDIMLEMLEDLGCTVDVASDGNEAVECARRNRYDLILMDMQMPRMDGLAATSAIRALPGHRDTPIIALTANAFAEDRQRCLAAGMNAHLGKPVTPSILVATLVQWLPDLAAPTEAPPCDNALSRALGQIAGLEVRSAWLISQERLIDYVAQLDRFIKTHAMEMGRLREHLVAGEHEAARVIAHNLSRRSRNQTG